MTSAPSLEVSGGRFRQVGPGFFKLLRGFGNELRLAPLSWRAAAWNPDDQLN